jgi:hypothetical protein
MEVDLKRKRIEEGEKEEVEEQGRPKKSKKKKNENDDDDGEHMRAFERLQHDLQADEARKKQDSADADFRDHLEMIQDHINEIDVAFDKFKKARNDSNLDRVSYIQSQMKIIHQVDDLERKVRACRKMYTSVGIKNFKMDKLKKKKEEEEDKLATADSIAVTAVTTDDMET